MKSRVKAGKPGGSNTGLDKLVAGLNEDPLLKEAGQRLPVDVHPNMIRKLDELKLKTLVMEGEKIRKVSTRMLVTEALKDLFEKYAAASAGEKVNTACQFHDGEEFTGL